jgi:ribonuclease HII
MMQELDQQYPQYGFGQHKGYGVSKWQAGGGGWGRRA